MNRKWPNFTKKNVLKYIPCLFTISNPIKIRSLYNNNSLQICMKIKPICVERVFYSVWRCYEPKMTKFHQKNVLKYIPSLFSISNPIKIRSLYNYSLQICKKIQPICKEYVFYSIWRCYEPKMTKFHQKECTQRYPLPICLIKPYKN